MAEKNNSLLNLANSSPGAATAAAQKGISQSDISQINAVINLRNIHKELTSLPRNDAFEKYNKYDVKTRRALASMFNPKYAEEDKGFFGNVLESIKTAAYYSGQDFKQFGANLVGIDLPGKATGNLPGAILGIGTAIPKAVIEESGVGGTIGGVVESTSNALVRAQKKLIMQPYQAQRLAEASGEDSLATQIGFIGKGFTELIPGGEDATLADASTNFMQYWEQASTPEKVYDPKVLENVTKNLTPELSYLGKLLADKEDIVDNFEKFQNNPAIIDLINRYVSGDEKTNTEVANAVWAFESAKISPGRDAARTIISLFPHEYEKALAGDAKAKAFFTGVSGGLDVSVTFGLDPLLALGKANRGLLAARYGFAKVGSGQISIERAFERRAVQDYWNSAGKLINVYRNGNLAQKSQALNRLQDRFPEINVNVVQDLAKADVKNAEDALTFFDNGQRFVEMLSGGAGIGLAGKSTLIPRMTYTRSISNNIKDSVASVLGTERYSSITTPAAMTRGQVKKTAQEEIKDFSNMFSENPAIWADKIGIEKAKIGFTLKDQSRLARIDRVVRQFSIAPSADKIIKISDASSANQVFKLARTVVDKTTAGKFRAAWVGADEGQRLLMYKGLLKTLGIGMGLNLSAEGRLALSKIDDMSKEIYSVSQSALDIGDLAKVLKTPVGGSLVSAPKGVRKLVQDATTISTAEGKAGRLIASNNARIAEHTQRIKALKADKADALAANQLGRADSIDDEIKILGMKLGREMKTKKELKSKLTNLQKNQIDEFDDVDIMSVDRFNAGQTSDGTPRAIRMYQLNDSRSLPNFQEWREIANRAGVLTELFGKATNSHFNRLVTDAWSFGNLYPRLGVRTAVEEVGTHFLIGGAEGFGSYLKGRLASRTLRAAQLTGKESTIVGKDITVFGKTILKGEKETKNLGFIYDNLYKIANKHYSKEQLLAMADDPELLGRAVADAIIKSKFKPAFLRTAVGKDIANWSQDFARFNGKVILDDITGASVRAERPITEAEVVSDSLKQFGPSVRLNVQNQDALKGMTFAPEFTEITSTNEKFVFNWLLELNNTLGKRNGQFGNIVLWNAGKEPEVVIAKLKKYIETDGNEIAKRFAIFADEGAEGLARQVYLDATYPLRDFAGQLNFDLINGIRSAGGMDNFLIDDLIKFDKPFKRPESILGQEIIPMGAGTAEQAIYRVINNGYGWVGKQIALIDREPITLGNYFMFRKELSGMEAATKKSLMANGLSPEGAESIARFSAHETALNLARNRTLGFVDNGDVRTNLAFNLRTLGRYYRATEDFYRRLGRLTKYEKRAIVRLAILNQTFENSGFIHEDDKGQMYFTYPGDDIINGALTGFLDAIGIGTKTPLPINFGGYVSMLTPSLDPESALPRLSNPFVSISLDAMTNLPFIGDYLKGVEKTLTGSFNTDVPAWEKAAPANIKRLYNVLAGSPESTQSRFSSITKAMKLIISTGNGPKNASELNEFFKNSAIQAQNIDAVKLVMGLGTPASIQNFATKDVPQEMINTGVFTWEAEFQKILKKYDGDEQAISKAMVTFAKLYPSKLAYTTSATSASTYADFPKSIKAANFVLDNQKLLLEHRDAGSFFIPVTGMGDIKGYSILKKQGFIKNKALDPNVEDTKNNFIREVSTIKARQDYFALVDDYNAKILSAPNPETKRYYREELSKRKKGMLIAYPLLAVSVTPTTEANARRVEVIDDMKRLLEGNKAPDKKLGNKFAAMITKYEEMQSILSRVRGSNDEANEFKKQLRADTNDVLLQLAKDNENATAFYLSVLSPLIGE